MGRPHELHITGSSFDSRVLKTSRNLGPLFLHIICTYASYHRHKDVDQTGHMAHMIWETIYMSFVIVVDNIKEESFSYCFHNSDQWSPVIFVT